MNRQDLTARLQQSSDEFADLIKAAQLPADLPDYNPEQVQAIEAIAQLVTSKQAKTFKEAGELFRKPQREAQLNAVAGHHAIATERIPDILNALKIKVETLTDVQLEQFTEVCQKLQAGVELAAAIPVKAVKGKKAAMPVFVPESEGESVSEGAITVATSEALAMLEVSEADQASLRDMADALAPEAVPDLAKEMVQVAGEVSGDLKQVAKQIFLEAALKQLKTQNNDPQRAVEMFRKLKRGESI
ncbi:MAG: hypothetical protein WCD18_06780 [Thermosynechococcaceae cyanobacterium]